MGNGGYELSDTGSGYQRPLFEQPERSAISGQIPESVRNSRMDADGYDNIVELMHICRIR